jgi:hypothetical protein
MNHTKITELLPQKQAADFLRISERSLERHRVEGKLKIPFIKIGRRVMYAREDLEAWINANRFNSTSEAKAA